MIAHNGHRRNVTGRARLGLTLLELVVSLTVSVLVLMAARGILSSLGDAASRVVRLAGQARDDLGGERVLRALAQGVDIQASGGLRYGGAGDSLTFQAWCPTARGWLERCTVRLAIIERLSVRFGRQELLLGHEWKPTALLLLTAPNLGGVWTTTWTDTLRLPQAIGVVRRRPVGLDTMILRIGERG